jgi:uncharacterized membrane protein HdeD (DUF308 family)
MAAATDKDTLDNCCLLQRRCLVRLMLMSKNKNSIHLIWGALLIAAGIGVFFRIPQVMPKIAKIEYFSSSLFFIRFCFYLIGILLIGGGIKKITESIRGGKQKKRIDIHEK